jgi:hypothetical protein
MTLSMFRNNELAYVYQHIPMSINELRIGNMEGTLVPSGYGEVAPVYLLLSRFNPLHLMENTTRPLILCTYLIIYRKALGGLVHDTTT